MRSRISSKLIFASCVGYFDRAYYGFYVTSSRMLVLFWGEQNLSRGTQWVYEYVTVDMYANLLHLLEVIWLTAVWGAKNELLGESGKVLLVNMTQNISVPCSPNTAFGFYNRDLYTWSNFGPYIVGGGRGYWQRCFYRRFHRVVLCSASFSVFLIYRYVKRNKLQIMHTIYSIIPSIW